MDIKEFIRKRGGSVTFHDFMEHALYCPEDGYYGAGKVKIGGCESDFMTHPELCSPIFAIGLLEEIYQSWLKLGKPKKLHIYEMGTGNGKLIQDLIHQSHKLFPDLAGALQIHVIEISSKLIEAAKKKIGRQKIDWILGNAINYSWSNNLEGVFIANELVDSFPVHRVKVKNKNLQELYVSLDSDNKFIEFLGELSKKEIRHYFAQLGFLPVENQHVVVNLAALRWLTNLGKKIKRGFIITIDYGSRAENLIGEDQSHIRTNKKLYHGTYPYKDVGNTDITSDIDFSSLIMTGRRAGLENISFETEHAFFQRSISRHKSWLENIEKYSDHFLTGRYQVLIQGKT